MITFVRLLLPQLMYIIYWKIWAISRGSKFNILGKNSDNIQKFLFKNYTATIVEITMQSFSDNQIM